MPEQTSLCTAAMTLALALLAAPAFGQDPLAVEIVTATHAAATRSFSLTGELAARDTLTASFPSGGRISAMLVARGEKVTAGTPLARIESVQQEQALRAAEAGVATAEASALKAQDDADRQEALLERGATTRAARDAAANQLSAAKATVAQAHADLDRAQKALDDTVLRSPADATVTDRMAEVGQVVGAAQPVLDLALGDRYDAIFRVPEVLLTTVPDSPEVSLAPVDRPKDTFTGTVRLISPLVDARTGTVKVTVSVTSPPRGVSFGDAVVGTVSRHEESQISLPWSAMSASAAGPAVWVVDPVSGTVSLHQVKVLRFETGRIVLSGGLNEGEKVVGLGSNLLYPGRAVRAAEVK